MKKLYVSPAAEMFKMQSDVILSSGFDTDPGAEDLNWKLLGIDDPLSPLRRK